MTHLLCFCLWFCWFRHCSHHISLFGGAHYLLICLSVWWLWSLLSALYTCHHCHVLHKFNPTNYPLSKCLFRGDYTQFWSNPNQLFKNRETSLCITHFLYDEFPWIPMTFWFISPRCQDISIPSQFFARVLVSVAGEVMAVRDSSPMPASPWSTSRLHLRKLIRNPLKRADEKRLVVWNIFFPYIGNYHHPSWLIFFRGFQTTNQIDDLVHIRSLRCVSTYRLYGCSRSFGSVTRVWWLNIFQNLSIYIYK